MKRAKSRKRADHSGSTFDSFLEQEGIREEVEAVAIERVIAWRNQRDPRRGGRESQMSLRLPLIALAPSLVGAKKNGVLNGPKA
jgi:hypothetical protein